jgi:hypothetical protein
MVTAMDWNLEVVVLGNTWAVQQLKVRGEKPLIPHEARGRFGEN